MRRWRVLLLLAFAGAGLASLLAGVGALEWRLPGGLPFGNLLAALVLAACAALAGFVAAGDRVGSGLTALAGLLALAWLPLSIALAGNLELSFGNGCGAAWIAYTLATLAAILLALAVGLATRLWRYLRQRSGAV